MNSPDKDKIAITEVFYTLQGEGKLVGKPSTFIRSFGCNFRCQGFGMPLGQLSNEYKSFDISKATSIKELPVANYGCDSYASWDPRCSHLSKKLDADELELECRLASNDNFIEAGLVITGGEPLLTGLQRFWSNFILEKYADKGGKSITFETNGTQEIRLELKETLSILKEMAVDVIFSVSPKLSSSGEKRDDAIQPAILEEYAEAGSVYRKYVITAPKDDLQEILEVEELYRQKNNLSIFDEVYLMPVGGTTETHRLEIKQEVAEICKSNGFNYSPRLQVDLWKNEWGT